MGAHHDGFRERQIPWYYSEENRRASVNYLLDMSRFHQDITEICRPGFTATRLSTLLEPWRSTDEPLKPGTSFSRIVGWEVIGVGLTKDGWIVIVPKRLYEYLRTSH